jgi:hypothetical protein
MRAHKRAKAEPFLLRAIEGRALGNHFAKVG